MYGGFHKWEYPQIIHLDGIFDVQTIHLVVPPFMEIPIFLFAVLDIMWVKQYESIPQITKSIGDIDHFQMGGLRFVCPHYPVYPGRIVC